MYFLIFLAASMLLAIPTYGISLVAFFIIKNWFDNRAMSALLGAAATAMREEISEERYHINRAAIRKVFSRFSDVQPEVQAFGTGGATLYWGVVRHPMINGHRPFSVRYVYLPRHGTKNTVFIKAAPGVDPDVLGVDDLNALLPGVLMQNAPEERVSTVRPKTDADIERLIVRLAKSGRGECDYPNLRYGAIADFADKSNLGLEFYPNYSGMRFWVNIDGFEYFVVVHNLDMSAKDDGGVSISVQLEGPAEEARTAVP